MRTQAQKLSGKLSYKHTAEISGFGGFPIDMLRYDAAFPADERDSAEIA